MVMNWILAFSCREKVAVYCSDVSGAFDRVSCERLLYKLQVAGVHYRIIGIISSWLQQRRAHVNVGGQQSDTIYMQDMVYQGTVLGPILWNLFFGDALHAIRMLKFMESVFADDLHACRSYDVKIPNRSLLDSTKRCQARLHEWGRANQVEFEPTKESITILSRATLYGDNFKSLGAGWPQKKTPASKKREKSWPQKNTSDFPFFFEAGVFFLRLAFFFEAVRFPFFF